MRARTPRWAPLLLTTALLVVVVGAALSELLPLVPLPPPQAPDYREDSAWLCRPGRADVCATPTTATVLAADGAKRTITYTPDPAVPIDCFYVYPTVSHASGDNAPIAATDDERGAGRQQLARFSTVCRPFAPLYRQVTRKGLGRIIDNPDPDATPRAIAYEDVVAAWHAYLARDNAGRGVVLIGHSQGAKILARLMAAEIDGTPEEAKLVSAIIPGTKVDVPAGQSVGGTFSHIPLCASAAQTGCVIAYSSYPADKPMPAKPRFGTTRTPGMVYACVDPAAVAGTPSLDADLPLWGDLREKFGTDFLELPGVVTATCKVAGAWSILAVTAAPSDRAGEPTSALLERTASFAPDFGLHALDIGLAEGTLVDIVRHQTAAVPRK